MANSGDRDNTRDRPPKTAEVAGAPVGSDDETNPDRNFITFASWGDLDNMKGWHGAGANVNIRESKTGATALHFAAVLKSREMINWLAKCDGIDFLIKDNDGRLPSALAFEVADDTVIGRYLAKKQAEQARARGIDLKTVIGS